jgi:hypothetical protein
MTSHLGVHATGRMHGRQINSRRTPDEDSFFKTKAVLLPPTPPDEAHHSTGPPADAGGS